VSASHHRRCDALPDDAENLIAAGDGSPGLEHHRMPSVTKPARASKVKQRPSGSA
jgi:hypothetical protein